MKKIIMMICLATSLLAVQKLNFYSDPLQAIEKGKIDNKKVIMFIYSTQCGWCSKMKETTFKDTKLIQLLNQKFIFSPVNQDSGILPPNLVPEFVPMTYIIDTKSNKVIHMIPGYQNADEFSKEISKF